MNTRWNRTFLCALALAGLVAFVVIPDRETSATIFLAAVAGLGWTFVLAYGIRSAWQSTAAGRGVMRLMLCMSLICTQGLVTILTDYSYPGRGVIRPLLLLFVALAVGDLLLTLFRLQRERRR